MQGGATLPDVLVTDDGQASVANETCLMPLPATGGRYGFANIGNTCFLNAALQPLLHTEPLMHLLIADPPLARISSPSASPQQKAVAEELSTIARHVWARNVEASVRHSSNQINTGFRLHISRVHM